jgi:hypothetical protein
MQTRLRNKAQLIERRALTGADLRSLSDILRSTSNCFRLEVGVVFQ